MNTYKYRFVEKKDKIIETWTRVHCFDENNVEIGYFDYDEPYNNHLFAYGFFVKKELRGQNKSRILFECLKTLATEKYTMEKIHAYIAPIEEGIEMLRLLNLFQKNGFTIENATNEDAWGIIEFKEKRFLNSPN